MCCRRRSELLCWPIQPHEPARLHVGYAAYQHLAVHRGYLWNRLRVHGQFGANLQLPQTRHQVVDGKQQAQNAWKA